MFGFIRKRRPIVLAHWIVPLIDFQSDTEAFYKAVEHEIVSRNLPGIVPERIRYRKSSWLSARRVYLRLRKERFAFDLCSASFGKCWWFSARAAELPRGWGCLTKIGLIALIVNFVFIYWYLFGWAVGLIVLGGSLVMLALLFAFLVQWGDLDDFLIHIPILGTLYEWFGRRNTFHRQDEWITFVKIANPIIKSKIVEFCAAGGVSDPEFIQIDSPQQMLSDSELAGYMGSADEGAAA